MIMMVPEDYIYSLSQVIHDLKDEIVDAVLKKSYITKKGHKLRTWRRRWFVLKKTIMRYYESKDKPVLKVQSYCVSVELRF